MRKYSVLKVILQSPDGITPTELSKNVNVALPNMYNYLRELEREGFITEHGGAYRANRTNEKTGQLMDLQAMAPRNFNRLITKDFKLLLQELCKKLKTEGASLSDSQIRKIDRIAIPLRIVLRISKRPAIYSLKVNEGLVTTLLRYHDLEADFSRIDFQKMIGTLPLVKHRDSTTPSKSDTEVAEMCNKFYTEEGDNLISRLLNFIPDQRLSELLKTTDNTNKEYTLFLNALDDNTKATFRDQWEKRYVYNTNSIEGNTMSQEDVNAFLKNGKKPESVSKRELFETENTSDALNFLKIKNGETVSQDLARTLHFLIQKNIDGHAGYYKNFYNYIKPNSPTTPPQHVKERMGSLIEWYIENEDKMHPFVLASIFHMQFEVVHPFADGNGRVGRLLMNHILTAHNYLPVTIMEKTKQNYYRALENMSLQQFLLYTLTGFIQEYER